ncbi:MAG: hypothetical protein [Microviridae sp.]|nr:MAG: hypothetical protein [Microviridae sp.]
MKKIKASQTTLRVNVSYEGETLEQKIRRIVNNKEPITDGAPLIYTDRGDGVRPEFDVRTDRFELAVEAMDKVSKTHLGKREERLKSIKPENGGTEPIQGTTAEGA